MDLLKGLKTASIESLSELWTDKRFKELVRLLHLQQENWAKYLLLSPASIDTLKELQWKATAFSIVIKTVESAYEKVNNIKHKRRKTNAGSTK